MIETERKPVTSTELENKKRIALIRLFEQHRKRLVRVALSHTRPA